MRERCDNTIKPYGRTVQRLLFLMCLPMLMACTEADQSDHPAVIEGHEEARHQAHMMDMERSADAPFTDGSLYQVESSWITQDADVIAFGDLRGRFQVIAMTYTSCEFACPLIVAAMKKILDQMPAEKKQHVGLVLISIDPERACHRRQMERKAATYSGRMGVCSLCE